MSGVHLEYILRGGGEKKWTVVNFGGDVQRGVVCTPHTRGYWAHAPPGIFQI